MPRSRDPVLAQILTVAQMRAAEESLISAGTGVDELMERAGRGAGEFVRRVAAGRSVTVLCGPGNNGGDGYVIARHLAEHGNPVNVVAALEPATDAARNARSLYPGKVSGPRDDLHGDVMVDCLFGSGLTRALPDDLAALLRRLGGRHHVRVAIDLPSGVESDSGRVLNDGLPHYNLTIALGAWKFAHWSMPACAALGVLRLIDIGVAPVLGAATLLGRPRIRCPAPDGHKYTRGLLSIVSGAMPGASLLAADAALRSGAGYVRLLAPARPEGVPHALVCIEVPQIAQLDERLSDTRISALLVGPGLGRATAANERLRAALGRAIPTVVDADALMLLPPGLIKGPCVLTPHEGEMAALERAFGLDGVGTRRARASALAVATGAVVILKGPDTVIGSPAGDIVLAPRATPWLSVAGTGDVLAGITASRLAVHRDPVRAACEGVWLHAEAARLSGPAFEAGELARNAGRALVAALA